MEELKNAQQVGWWVIGEGKFGEIGMGKKFEPLKGDTEYWIKRGYELIAVYVDFDYVENECLEHYLPE